jgi:4-hydroxybenzoate polyprenyltransferase
MYENADPTWAKLLFEYGVIGLVVFVTLVFYSTFRSRAPAELIAALCIGWFIIWGGVALAPEITALIFILCAVAAVPPVRRQLRQRVVADIGHLGMPTRSSR